MKLRNAVLLLAVVLISALPLLLVPQPLAGANGQKAEIFAGADNKARDAITQIAPGYRPWFEPLLEPASGEIASLLFALQAALGAGVIGYLLGYSKGRSQALAAKAAATSAPLPGAHAD